MGTTKTSGKEDFYKSAAFILKPPDSSAHESPSPNPIRAYIITELQLFTVVKHKVSNQCYPHTKFEVNAFRNKVGLFM